jgi:hypothetical protein
MVVSQARCFGAHHHEQVKSASLNTTINIPTEAEIKYQVAAKPNLNDKFLFWLQGRFPVDRLSDKLINDKVNTYSAYHHFGTNALL